MTLASALARDADAIATQLDAGDACGAVERAQALQQRTIEALNSPRLVPAALKEDLGVAVADVVDRTESECAAAQARAQPQPAPPTVAEDEGEDHGDEANGNGKRDRGKHKGRKGKD